MIIEITLLVDRRTIEIESPSISAIGLMRMAAKEIDAEFDDVAQQVSAMKLTGTIRFVLTRSLVCNRPFQSAGLGEASGGGSAVFCAT